MMDSAEGVVTMTDVLMKSSEFYVNPCKQTLDELEYSLGIYLREGLTTVEVKNQVIKMAKKYLKDIENEHR